MTDILGQIQSDSEIIFENFSQFESYVERSQDVAFNEAWPPCIAGTALYRGQANPVWKLETTLDRKIPECSVSAYYDNVFRAYFEISSFSEKNWPLPEIQRIRKECQEYNNFPGLPQSLPSGEYLSYLRHYGFPSPLLDWTRSPYVAAFFAYRNRLNSEQNHVSIYVADNVSKELAGPVVKTADSMHFVQVGRYMIADRRHYVQQSDYTTCLQYRSGQWFFSNHDDFFKSSASRNIKLTRCLLPAKDRLDVLRRLDKMNINALSLFSSIESLMETASNRQFEFV